MHLGLNFDSRLFFCRKSPCQREAKAEDKRQIITNPDRYRDKKTKQASILFWYSDLRHGFFGLYGG